MASPAKKKGYRLRFDLTLGGLLGVAVVLFCIFLWMFLLGVWAGQSGLLGGFSFSGQRAIPSSPTEELTKPVPFTSPPAVTSPGSPEAPARETENSTPSVEPSPTATPSAPKAASSASTPDVTTPNGSSTSYALQVGAFREQRYVEEALREWHDKGFQSFSQPPSGPAEHLTKVFIGRFPDADAARAAGEILTKREGISPIVVQIQGGEAKRP